MRKGAKKTLARWFCFLENSNWESVRSTPKEEKASKIQRSSKMTLIALTNNYSNNGVVPVVDLTLATLAGMGQED